ncbi:hypothetical protein L7F22_019105 [Adiantum nelumboides]|nr:hypothetical protein [Adiantum nelumboides]
MSSSNSQLSYTPYQSHRRAASAVSVGGSKDIPQASAANQTEFQRTTPAESSLSNHKPTAQRSQLSNTVRPIISPVGSNTSNNPVSAPPPLRSLSSLKAKPVDGKVNATHSTLSKEHDIKGKSNENKEASSSKALPIQSPSRRTVSSSLAVPSTSSSGTAKPLNAAAQSDSNRQNGHSKRNSMTASPIPSQSHNRSISNGSIPVTLPHHMSTAQRLRTVSPLDFSTPSSSSPTQTPNAPLSPAFGASAGGLQTFSNQLDSNGNFYEEGVGRRTAYRAGFQPKGSYRIRTDEFVAARNRRKQGGRGESNRSGNGTHDSTNEVGKSRSELESQRLERRLEKLFALHYDDTPLFTEEEAYSLAPGWLPGTIRKARLQAEMEKRLRDEEMRIVNWEDDKSRKACSICTTPFSFTVRKHHCRLCGRVVCASPHLSLPPGITGPPSNTEEGKIPTEDQVKCSSLVVADDQTGTKIKDVPRWDEASSKHLDANGRTRGIRICRECKETILHRQYMLDDGNLPGYVKLYEALISLQKEIEQSLPEFQEMILGLQKHDAAAALGTSDQQDESHDPLLQPVQSETLSMAAIKAKNRTTLALQRDAAQARKQLLANFANYDLIAKKIRNLDDEGNASLARLKVAIWTQANTFLQANMFPLQNLPKLQNSSSANGKSSRNGVSKTSSVRGGGGGGGHKHSSSEAGSTSTTKDVSSSIRDQLTVLQQQLTLVRQYAASASKSRKFQDASSLNQSARELEVEIERLQKML